MVCAYHVRRPVADEGARVRPERFIAKVHLLFVVYMQHAGLMLAGFQIPKNLTFDQASTIPLGFTTAAIGLYQDKRDRGGAGLVAPWVDGGRGKYAGQAIYIPGGSSSISQYGTLPLRRVEDDDDEIKNCMQPSNSRNSVASTQSSLQHPLRTRTIAALQVLLTSSTTARCNMLRFQLLSRR